MRSIRRARASSRITPRWKSAKNKNRAGWTTLALSLRTLENLTGPFAFYCSGVPVAMVQPSAPDKYSITPVSSLQNDWVPVEFRVAGFAKLV